VEEAFTVCVGATLSSGVFGALTVDASSPVVYGSDVIGCSVVVCGGGVYLSSGDVERSVSIGGIYGGAGVIFMCVCLWVLAVAEG